MTATPAHFRAAYAAHRAGEGRGYAIGDLLALPYLPSGPLARQWEVRARSYEAFASRVLLPAARALDRPLRLLDLGAGNGWLCWRAALAGCDAVAVDVRDDDVDGLAAARPYLERASFHRVAASFDALSLAAEQFDVVVFTAALHYATDLGAALGEARRVARRGARLVILDSPFYARDADGAAMVAEKRQEARRRFGERAEVLLSIPSIEYLTRQRLADASESLGLVWHRHRVRYPLWYEARPAIARLLGRRTPSRFDLWECTTP